MCEHTIAKARCFPPATIGAQLPHTSPCLTHLQNVCVVQYYPTDGKIWPPSALDGISNASVFGQPSTCSHFLLKNKNVFLQRSSSMLVHSKRLVSFCWFYSSLWVGVIINHNSEGKHNTGDGKSRCVLRTKHGRELQSRW